MGKFMFISNSGDGLGLAFKLKDAGHQVAALVKSDKSKKNFDRMMLKFQYMKQAMVWADKKTTFVFDSNGNGEVGDRLRMQGYAVFMGSKFADILELDRDAAFEYMGQVGIKFPRTEPFQDWDSGKKFIKGNKDERWVFKPSGPLADNDAVGSYVAHDSEDMIQMMDYWASVHSGGVEYILQQFLEGVAISTEGWFNGHEWMTPFNHTVERKQIANDNLGPSCGCSGNAVWGWFYGDNHIIEDGIQKMGPILEEFGYAGPIDLNTVVNEEGVWALEFTPRFGYDALPALLKLYQGDFAELLETVARGEHPKEMSLKRGFGTALRVSVPPYPSEEFKHVGGIPIRGWEKEHRPDLYFYEVMLDEKNRFVTSPAFGAVAAIQGYGMELEEAFLEPNRLARLARIPEKQYRTDIVKVLDMDYAKFQRLVDIRRRALTEVGGNP
jgi:phosphoribosylamine--glycine ligase